MIYCGTQSISMMQRLTRFFLAQSAQALHVPLPSSNDTYVICSSRREFLLSVVALCAAMILCLPFVHFGFAEDALTDNRSPPQQRNIVLDEPTLAPFAHTRFCLEYFDECQRDKFVSYGVPVKLNANRWADIVNINADVNRFITPERNYDGAADKRWVLWPKFGDCNDYAVTKRHELLARGWPSQALLLAEVATPWGEHHLVLVVRSQEGDFVLDNLNQDVRLWSLNSYKWVRIQSPRDPSLWSTIVAKSELPVPSKFEQRVWSNAMKEPPSRTAGRLVQAPILRTKSHPSNVTEATPNEASGHILEVNWRNVPITTAGNGSPDRQQ